MTDTALTPAQSMPVFRADGFVVSQGANLGDALSVADELMLDDIYALSADAQLVRLALHASDTTHMIVADGSDCGAAGAAIHLDCALTLMSPDGQITDAIVLVEVDDAGHIAEIYLLPLAALAPRTPYNLVGIDRDEARTKFAHLACARFTRGTHITMASGAQKPIEELEVGDRVLTRNDGVQEVRWVGQSTVRATGDFAPIRIRAGTLNNDRDLIVSPDHRLFIYQRKDRLGAGRSELLVKARHLVNGDSVTVQDGGFVDYFELLFDTHQIIYAEGIAAESMLIDTRTKPVLPDEVSSRLTAHTATGLSGLDVTESLLDRPDAAELLKRASSR
ncbi:Hint domain-containing protein [Tateyamaria omphalii]|uniref:Hint domain-containing protein n=1 Tax=Tateyamaria omphalii TaxID=299262 RepID=UPI001C99074C|nr:Hint domain-containing protein [Tateyamaria omphalii]MBY5932261.1 Hint domain-containing protein [Tateyamaria omphalii]